jgi:hypothetical protein
MPFGPRHAQLVARSSLLAIFAAACLAVPGCGDEVSKQAGSIELPARTPGRVPTKEFAKKKVASRPTR